MTLRMHVMCFVVRCDYLISDSANHRVQLCTASGTCNTVAGTGLGGDSDTQLRNPTFVAIMATANNFISDFGNNRVQLCPAHGAGLQDRCGNFWIWLRKHTARWSDGASH